MVEAVMLVADLNNARTAVARAYRVYRRTIMWHTGAFLSEFLLYFLDFGTMAARTVSHQRCLMINSDA